MGQNDYKAGENYILPRDGSEFVRQVLVFRAVMFYSLVKCRLNVQHVFLKTMVYDGKLIYDDSIELGSGSAVLDSGTGSGD